MNLTNGMRGTKKHPRSSNPHCGWGKRLGFVKPEIQSKMTDRQNMQECAQIEEENPPVFSSRFGVPHPAALLSLMRNASALRVAVDHTSLLPPSLLPPSLLLPGLTLSLFLNIGLVKKK